MLKPESCKIKITSKDLIPFSLFLFTVVRFWPKLKKIQGLVVVLGAFVLRGLLGGDLVGGELLGGGDVFGGWDVLGGGDVLGCGDVLSVGGELLGGGDVLPTGVDLFGPLVVVVVWQSVTATNPRRRITTQAFMMKV